MQGYTLAIGTVIEPWNIKFVSRISHGRVCLYLVSKETAGALMENHKKIPIGSQSLKIRSLMSRAKRIIISNACPVISNHEILAEHAKANITPCSQITYIRAGINDPGFSHALTFRPITFRIRKMYGEFLHQFP